MPRNSKGSLSSGAHSRAPAHQNGFAFKHNPNSKKTAKILSLPINNVCARCSSKLQWRKKYRKYKPLTQPKTCVDCKGKTVRAAYHVVCTPCGRKRGEGEGRIVCEMCLGPRDQEEG
ncbi:hypothetical protein TrRE_jg2191, partial [Triparma retinervis]